jgi:RNA polymerase sigma factor (sigma-70 family)
VREAIAALPDDVRDVVLLTTFTPLGYDEVGAALGIPAGTVGSRRHRALRMLRERLGKESDEQQR